MAEEVRRDRRAAEAHEEQEDDEEAAADRDLVAPEPPPDLLPVATGAYRLRAFAELRRLDLDDAVEPGRTAAPEGCSALGSPESVFLFLGGHGFLKGRRDATRRFYLGL